MKSPYHCFVIAMIVLALSSQTKRPAFAMQPAPQENQALTDLLRRVQAGSTEPAIQPPLMPRGDIYGPPVQPLPNGPPRRWYLYFPSAAWDPAIIGPPVRMFLDPPYEINDPFARGPNWDSPLWGPGPALDPNSQFPSSGQTALPPAPQVKKPYGGPKVIEWNPATGQSEVVSPPRTGGTSGGAIRLSNPAPVPLPPAEPNNLSSGILPPPPAPAPPPPPPGDGD